MRNNKIILLIAFLGIIIGIGMFLPKSFTKAIGSVFTSSGGSGVFGKNHSSKDDVPSVLKWKKSFVYEKKRTGSYMDYMQKKNK